MPGFDEASLADEVGNLPPGNCLIARESGIGGDGAGERPPVEIAGGRHADNALLRRIKRMDIGNVRADLSPQKSGDLFGKLIG